MKLKQVVARAVAQQAGSGKLQPFMLPKAVIAVAAVDPSSAPAVIDMAATEMVMAPDSFGLKGLSQVLRAAATARYLSPVLLQAATSVVRHAKSDPKAAPVDAKMGYHLVKSLSQLHQLALSSSTAGTGPSRFASSSSSQNQTLSVPQLADWAAASAQRGLLATRGSGIGLQALLELLDACAQLMGGSRCAASSSTQQGGRRNTVGQQAAGQLHNVDGLAKACMSALLFNGRVSAADQLSL
jgi:hypothetical protein